MTGFTDIHSHFIYGVDDGAKTRADMEAMLDAAHADGIVSLFATPHVTPGIHPFDAAAYLWRLDEARSYCQARNYGMQLYPGAEILYTPALEQYMLNHRLPTLDGSDNVLIEFAPGIAFRELENAVEFLERGGYIPVLAHIERYQCLYIGQQAAKLKRNHNVHYQVNANTVLTEHGFFRARHIRNWFQKELIDFVASDAHDATNRPFRMKRAFDALARNYGRRYAFTLAGAQR